MAARRKTKSVWLHSARHSEVSRFAGSRRGTDGMGSVAIVNRFDGTSVLFAGRLARQRWQLERILSHAHVRDMNVLL
jgi:hypothetical protein